MKRGSKNLKIYTIAKRKSFNSKIQRLREMNPEELWLTLNPDNKLY